MSAQPKPIQISYTKTFYKNYRQYIKTKKLQSLVDQKIDLFRFNQHQASLKCHALVAKLVGFHAFSIKHDLRIIFKWGDNKQSAKLIYLGPHSKVY